MQTFAVRYISQRIFQTLLRLTQVVIGNPPEQNQKAKAALIIVPANLISKEWFENTQFPSDN